MFFLDNQDISECMILLDTCIDIRKVNVTKFESNAHKGDTLTVYPKPMIDGKSLEKSVKALLDEYFSGVHEEVIEVDLKVHFKQ